MSRFSKHERNGFNTTGLVLNVMATVARSVKLDINDDDTADRLYQICSVLESFPQEEGFGSSDHYSYIEEAKAEFKHEIWLAAAEKLLTEQFGICLNDTNPPKNDSGWLDSEPSEWVDHIAMKYDLDAIENPSLFKARDYNG